MGTFLLVCHDAGGTIPPMLALAESLITRGHEVVVLSQPSVQRRAEAVGCAFVAFSNLADYAARAALEEQLDLIVPAMTGREVADDLVALAKERGVDAVVVDANLTSCLAAAETLDQPSAVLLHSMYRTYIDTWFGELWPLLEPVINEMRAGFGLAPASGWPAIFAGHDRLIAVVPAAFDAPVPDVPHAMRHFGFLVPRARPSDDRPAVDFPPGDDPAVLVGLSTTYQQQESVLSNILDALATVPVRALVTTAGQVDTASFGQSPNVTVADYVQHPLVLDHTDLMITHAGMGSIAAAMTFGVPVVCIPHSRDQPLNAARVADLGAGIALSEHPTTAVISDALELVLSDPGYRECARALGTISRHAGGADAAAAELEGLVAT
jgi:UDP:flavonoid glycosyltransferase YjiC (YdhE family)